MRMRKGAPLLFALAALLGMAQAAPAAGLGLSRFSIFRSANCDAQCCYSSCQQQNRACYKLVYDTVEEKRWHTTYKTECVTVNKPVTRTCYKDECKTMYRSCKVTKYRDEVTECCKPVTRTCYKEIQCVVNKPCIESGFKDVACQVCRRVAKICEKDCCYTVCKPVYEQHCHVQCCQVRKTICEQRTKECCQTICRRVCETCYKPVCCQVSKCVEECCMKQVCVSCCKDVMETCYKTCTRRVCETVTTKKTVTKRIVECVDEPCAPGSGPFRNLFRGSGNGGGILGHGGACGANGCNDPCFDPCACKTFHLFNLGGLGSRLHGDPCNVKCDPCPLPTTRKVWRVRCVTEEVPCTKTVTRCITEQVPYTVCKKVRYNEMKQVPYTVRRNYRGAYVDDKGVAHECDGAGRKFTPGAVIRKEVPYTVTRNVTTVEKKLVPYTVSRCVVGAYVDAQGNGHTCDGPDRTFKVGAQAKITHTTCKKRMVQERVVKKVQYTTYENVMETQIKKVPYQTCRMVPTTITKKVPEKVCEMQKYTVTKKVAYTECIQMPYTVTCKVPYTVTENVPQTIRTQVKVCVPETVCIKRARMVPVDPGKGPGGPAACGPNGCGPTTTGCNDGCAKHGFGRWFGCGNDGCGTDNCRENRHCVLSGDRQRWFASLHTTGCCEETCKSSLGNRISSGFCGHSRNDGCHDFCNEGLLHRLFRNRFCCEPTNGCAATTKGAVAPATPPMSTVPDAIPTALPK